MPLDYLDFDFSDDGQGQGSFDAMAAVTPAQWPALRAEVQRVLAWAHDSFGPPQGEVRGDGDGDGAEWDYDLQGVREVPYPLSMDYDSRLGLLQLREGPPGEARLTLSLTLTGSPGFCDALRAAFDLDA